jgi:DNA-binding NtrC family response regulator/tetratricopeptide (TPR) repeat protein
MQHLADLLGDSPQIRAVKETISRLLERQSGAGRLPPVLVLGETGTGKGLLARLLHEAGPRRAGAFVDVNCAAIPETLLEAELFGFERGAFTDARQPKAGLFQTAHRGTLFLDEIALLPEPLQGKLLTAIEERSVRRLGSTRNEPVDVWILTATNDELPTLIRQGRFREDLYHRLAVLTVALPPLRERGGDIPLLAEHFLARACTDYGLPPKRLAPEAREALLGYAWPGNIRELANAMERAALLGEGPVVTCEALALPLAGAPESAPGIGSPAGDEDPVRRLERERDELMAALQATDWNISRAAARLGIPRNTLRYRVAKHRLHPDAPRPATAGRPARAPAPAPAQPATPASTPAAPAALRWERRRLTFLRAVLVAAPAGSEPGAEATRALEAVVEKVQSFGGRVEELSAGGLIAVFGLEALEDPARRAAHAAMAIQRNGERARRANPDRPAIRLGLHTEQVAVGQRGGVTEIDADARRQEWTRLEALTEGAAPGTIRVSAATAPFLARRFELAGEAGLPGEPPIHRLVGLEQAGGGRRLAGFVGRRDELTLLRNRLAAVRRGHGQAVGISGEAGIGKSRLLHEFRQSLAGEAVTYLEGQCASYATAIPYAPLVEMLRQNCRLTDADAPETIVDKVRAGVAAVGMDPDSAAPFLLHLLGVKEGTEALADLSPEAIQTRMFAVLWQMSLEGSRRRPVIFVLEDLHWVDRASEDYLNSLVESLAGAAILLLLTYRPGYQPRWLTKSYATQIALSPLDPDESLALVRSVFPVPALPDDVVGRLIETADGNPFFLEELARTVEGRTGPPPAEAEVPGTIEEVLLARMERLADEPRELLQTAAILGREIPLRLLRAMWTAPVGLDGPLRELARLEFLYVRPGEEEPVSVFTHALTREVARESLPVARRLALHAAAGHALEALYADRLDTVVDRLAYHYSKAKLADQAVEYLGQVADKAAGSYAHVEAVGALREALEHADRLPADQRPTRRLELVLRLAHCLSFLGRFPEVRELLVAEAGHVDTVPALTGAYHFWLANTYSYLGDYAHATEHAQRAWQEAEREQDAAIMGRASVVLAQEHYWAGQPLHGIARGRRAAELLEAAGERWWLGLAHWVVGINYIIIGAFELALEAETRALDVGEGLGDPRIQSYATWSTGWIQSLTGEWDAGIETCRRGLGRSPDPLNTAVALGHLGYAYLEKGDGTQAISALDEAVARMAEFGFRQLEGRFSTFLGEAHLLEGRLSRARELVNRGVRLSAEARYWYGLGWGRHALGRIAHAAGDLAEADQQLAEALETFNRIHARFMVARTHLSLAAVSRGRGDLAAAARHLVEAEALFRVLRVPYWADRATALAREWGVPLGDDPRPALAVVRRGEADLFQTLQTHLDALNLGQVIWDRRTAERRRRPAGGLTERRRQDRRRPLPTTWDTLGFLVAP